MKGRTEQSPREGGSRAVAGPLKARRLPRDRLSNNCYECDLVPKMLNLCLFQFKVLNFWESLETSEDPEGGGTESCEREKQLLEDSLHVSEAIIRGREGVRWTVFQKLSTTLPQSQDCSSCSSLPLHHRPRPHPHQHMPE